MSDIEEDGEYEMSRADTEGGPEDDEDEDEDVDTTLRDDRAINIDRSARRTSVHSNASTEVEDTITNLTATKAWLNPNLANLSAEQFALHHNLAAIADRQDELARLSLRLSGRK